MALRAVSTLHGRRAAGVPRWAVRAAYATTFTVLPSCVWRIAAMGFHGPLLERTAAAGPGHGPVLLTGWWYVTALSLVSEALAYLTVGLVSVWGEVVPRCVPGVGGRPVPVLAAVVPAGLGAVALLVFPYALIMMALGRTVDGTSSPGLVVHGWQAVVFALAYAPLAAWGPLLGVVTVHYYRRRRRAAPAGHVADTAGAGAADPPPLGQESRARAVASRAFTTAGGSSWSHVAAADARTKPGR